MNKHLYRAQVFMLIDIVYVYMSYCLACCPSFVIWGYYIHAPPRSICIHLFVAQTIHIHIHICIFSI